MSDYQPLGMWDKLKAWRNYEALKPGVEQLASSFSKMPQQLRSLQSQGDPRAQTAAGLLQMGKLPFQPLASAFARPSVPKPYKGPLKPLPYPELLTTKESSMPAQFEGMESYQPQSSAESGLRSYQKKQERKRLVGFERQRKSPLAFRADSELIKKAQEVKSLVMLKVAAAKVMLGRGVDPSLIATMLKFSKDKTPLNLTSATLAGAAAGGLGGGLSSLSASADARWPAATLARVMAGIVGGGLTGRAGGAGYNWAVSDKSTEKPQKDVQEKGKGSRGSVQSRSSLTKESSMLVKRAQRQEVKSLVMLKVAAAQVMLRRGVNPAVITAVLTAGGEKRADITDFLARMSTGFTRRVPETQASSETVKANEKVKLQPLPEMRSKAKPKAPALQTTKESSTLVKRAQRQEVKALVMLKVAAAQVMLRRGVNPSVINAVLQVGHEKRAERDALSDRGGATKPPGAAAPLKSLPSLHDYSQYSPGVGGPGAAPGSNPAKMLAGMGTGVSDFFHSLAANNRPPDVRDRFRLMQQQVAHMTETGSIPSLPRATAGGGAGGDTGKPPGAAAPLKSLAAKPFDWGSLLNSGMLSHAGIGAALGGGIGGLHGLLDDDDDEDDEYEEGGRRKHRPKGMAPVLSRALGGAAIGGLGGAAASAAGVPAMLGFPPKA